MPLPLTAALQLAALQQDLREFHVNITDEHTKEVMAEVVLSIAALVRSPVFDQHTSSCGMPKSAGAFSKATAYVFRLLWQWLERTCRALISTSTELSHCCRFLSPPCHSGPCAMSGADKERFEMHALCFVDCFTGFR